jgi:O-antigen/teichoic acid export membrane protein
MALVTGAKVIGGISLLALNVWVARHLAPAAYGWFAIASTGALLVDGVIGSAIDAAILRRSQLEPGAAWNAAERAGLALKLAAGATLCTAAAAIALALNPSITAMALLAMLAGTGLLMLRSTLVYFQLRARYTSFALVDLAHTAVRWGAVAASFALILSPTAVIAGLAGAAWVVTGIAMMLSGPIRTRGERLHSDFDGVAGAARVAFATTAVGAIVARLDLMLIGAFGTPTDAGIFGAASTIALAPMWLGAYLAPVFSARILPYCRDQRLELLFRSVQRSLIALAIVGVAIGAIAGPWVLERLLPPE